jgi:hypothetical protein
MEDDSNLSIVQSPRASFDIVKLEDPRFLESFLDEPATFIAETITGALATGPKGMLASGGRIVHALLKGRLFIQWGEEFKTLRDAGRLKEDFAETKYGFQTWVELMAIIDEDAPDADRLEALKAMFYAVNKAKAEDAERIQAYQLWQIAKRMNSAELLLLKAMNGEDEQSRNWERHIAEKSGLGLLELVALYEKSLSELKLIQSRFDYVSGAGRRNAAVITALGQTLCNNIETYQIDLETAKRAKAK